MHVLETRIPPLILTVLAVAVTWLLSRIDAPVGFLNNGTAQLAALGFWLIGAGVMVEALSGFLRARTSVDPHHVDKASSLVTGGIYRFTRNPMYLGMVFGSVGAAVWLATILGFVGPALLVVALTRLQIVPEERQLEASFGEDYRVFKKSTRRWL